MEKNLEIGDIVKIERGVGKGLIGQVDDFTEKGTPIIALYHENQIYFQIKQSRTLTLIKKGE